MSMATFTRLWDILLVELAVLVYAVHAPSHHRTCGVVTGGHIVFVAFFAPYMIDIAGYATSVSTIWRCTIVLGQCLVLELWGVRAARAALPLVSGWMAFMFAMSFALSRLPIPAGQEDFGEAVKLILTHANRTMVAAFVAWWASQAVLIVVWRAVRHKAGRGTAMLVATLAAQLIDTPTFSIPAFWPVLAWSQLVESMTLGLAIKSLFAVAVLPLFWLLTAKHPQPKLCGTTA